jgi:Cu/Ag efflux protein CusF
MWIKVALIFAVLAMLVTPVWAQQYPTPGASGPAGSPNLSRPVVSTPLEGTVKKVDPGARTVQVSSGLLGLFGRTLEVTSDTKIQVEGKQATLADIHEGAKVRASYEAREGKNIATRLEVMPTPPAKAPTGQTAPKMPEQFPPANIGPK